MKVHPTICDKPRVVIIGAGVIGLAVAWRLAAREVSVTLLTKAWLAAAQATLRPGCWRP
jgi:glycine/D-amino acid oxidase-like deaminating enzyme